MKIIKIFLKLVVIAILIMILCIGDAFFIEPDIIVKKDYKLQAKEKTGGTTLKVVQISDIHFGKFFDEERLVKLVNKVNKTNADIILFTGDLYDVYASYPETDPVITQLSRMKAAVGKYAIWGNRDYGGGAVRVYDSVMESSRFTVLKNEVIQLDIEGGKTLALAGIDDSVLGNPETERVLEKIPDSDYTILMSHEPDIADEFTQTDFDIMLSGHSHGGQVRLPFINPMSTTLAVKYTEGWYDIGKEDARLYVNTGIGTTKIPVRFLVPPQIAVFNVQF